jgi:hypothetical protein
LETLELIGSRVRIRRRRQPDCFGRIAEVCCSVTLESAASSFKASTFRIILETGDTLETTGVNIVVENEHLAQSEPPPVQRRHRFWSLRG